MVDLGVQVLKIHRAEIAQVRVPSFGVVFGTKECAGAECLIVYCSVSRSPPRDTLSTDYCARVLETRQKLSDC